MQNYLFILLIMLVHTSPAFSATYKWVDSKGKVHYTDQLPPAEAKKIETKKLPGNVIGGDNPSFELREVVRKYPVTIYVTDCGEICDKARQLLTRRGVPFTEKNPQIPPIADELKSLTGANEIPVMVIGETKYTKGFEEQLWNSQLDIAGYPAAARSTTNATPASGKDKPAPPAAPK